MRSMNPDFHLARADNIISPLVSYFFVQRFLLSSPVLTAGDADKQDRITLPEMLNNSVWQWFIFSGLAMRILELDAVHVSY